MLAFETGSPQVNGIVSVSKTHNEANVRRTRDESVEGFRKIVELRNNTPAYANLKVGCGLPTALGCTLEGNVAESEVLKKVTHLYISGNRIRKEGIDALKNARCRTRLCHLHVDGLEDLGYADEEDEDDEDMVYRPAWRDEEDEE